MYHVHTYTYTHGTEVYMYMYMHVPRTHGIEVYTYMYMYATAHGSQAKDSSWNFIALTKGAQFSTNLIQLSVQTG